MDKVLVVCGPTATGKTALAAKCAKLLNSAVISADSQLVYKGLNIGTAKPTKEEMLGVEHYMIDVAEPTQDYSVFDYQLQATTIINEIIGSGKIPVICGGTGFYINSLLFDYSYGGVSADNGIREKYLKIEQTYGKEYLHSLLEKHDPDTAAKLHPNDIKRVVRALEISETGIKKSQLNDGKKKKYDYLAIAIDYAREELYDRINKRVDRMFELGLIDEVRGLILKGIDESCRCMQAIGYKEVIECIEINSNESTMRDKIKQNTRRYAKRQITFFKKLEGIVWLKPDELKPENVMEMLKNV